MSESTQGRLPAGSADGGQFTEKPLSHPEANLSNLTQGSFLFPPADYGPEGVKSYLEFWENAPISDRVLSNLITAYDINRNRFIERAIDDWARDYQLNDKEFRARKFKAENGKFDPEEHKRLFEVARSEKLAEIRALRPHTTIQITQARGIAVAARIYECSGTFTPEEQAIIDAHKIKISRAAEPASVAEIWQAFHLGEITDMAFTDQDLAVQYELMEMRRFSGAYTYV